MKLATNKTNKIIIEALGSIKETMWSGNTTHTTMQSCLASINLQSANSGHYNPSAVRIAKLTGWFMVNEDGSLYFEARIIKESDNEFTIEHLSNSGYNAVENKYRELS